MSILFNAIFSTLKESKAGYREMIVDFDDINWILYCSLFLFIFFSTVAFTLHDKLLGIYIR
jgi:hypothetical protein